MLRSSTVGHSDDIDGSMGMMRRTDEGMGSGIAAAGSKGHGSIWAEDERLLGGDVRTELLVVAGALRNVLA